MFYSPNTTRYRARNSARSIGMRHYICICGLSFLDCGFNLGFRVLRSANWVSRRSNSPGGHYLDLRGALLDLLAHGKADIVDAINDSSNGARPKIAGAGL